MVVLAVHQLAVVIIGCFSKLFVRVNRTSKKLSLPSSARLIKPAKIRPRKVSQIIHRKNMYRFDFANEPREISRKWANSVYDLHGRTLLQYSRRLIRLRV